MRRALRSPTRLAMSASRLTSRSSLRNGSRQRRTSSAASPTRRTNTAGSSMRPPEEEIRLLVGEWIKKADLDFKTVVRLSAESEFRDIVGFHAQCSAVRRKIPEGSPYPTPDRVSEDSRHQAAAHFA